MQSMDGIDHRREVVGRLPSPACLRERIPASVAASEVVLRARHEVSDVISGEDDRLIAVVGPCSVHDHTAVVEYAQRLATLAEDVQETLLLVMRVYVEKPRTRLGWTGLVSDPLLDGSADVEEGLLRSRRLMCDVLDIGLPVACEFLDPFVAPYLADLVAWGSVGARTVHSQPHRHLASGLSMPIGIKNPTSGRPEVAVDAIISGGREHVIPGIDDHGFIALFKSAGNPDCHLVLRGGLAGSNCSPLDVARTVHLLKSADLPACVVIDASHGNSNKDPNRQCAVVADIAERIAGGERGIAGVMMESFLAGGRQDLASTDPDELVFGQSITDACASWTETVDMIEALAGGVADRRELDLPAEAR